MRNSTQQYHIEADSTSLKLLENKSKAIQAEYGIKILKQKLKNYIDCYNK